jgi:anti-anti-sigma factor
MTELAGRADVIDVEERREAAVLHVHADIDATVAPQLRRYLAAAVDRHVNVVVDLADAGTVDPTGLALLVRAHCRARRRAGTICFAAPSRFVVTALHTMRVDTVFPLFDDCASALAWLRRNSSETAPDRHPVPRS